MKKKLELRDLNVKSFVTEKAEVKGGCSVGCRLDTYCVDCTLGVCTYQCSGAC